MVVQLQSFMNFDFDSATGHITRHARESGEERIINAMKIDKGKPPSTMYIHVQELSQNRVSSNGDIVKVDELYFPGDSQIIAPPYLVDQNDKDSFRAEIVFAFQYQYSFNNYSADLMDAMSKFALICVVYYLIFLGIRTTARGKFYKELSELIMRVDKEVHV